MKQRAIAFLNFVYRLQFHKNCKVTGTWSVTICESNRLLLMDKSEYVFPHFFKYG